MVLLKIPMFTAFGDNSTSTIPTFTKHNPGHLNFGVYSVGSLGPPPAAIRSRQSPWQQVFFSKKNAILYTGGGRMQLVTSCYFKGSGKTKIRSCICIFHCSQIRRNLSNVRTCPVKQTQTVSMYVGLQYTL